MALRVFRGSRASYSHENRAFNALARSLADALKAEAESPILIGNFYWNQAQVDAAFVTRTGITLIDFKSYSGRLQISENGRWICNGVEVKGGSHENPLLQLGQVRQTIRGEPTFNFPRLSVKAIKGCVVFDAVVFDSSGLPTKARPWFFVTDLQSAARVLLEMSSSECDLSSEQISSLITGLAVRAYHGYADTPVPVALEPLAALSDEKVTSQSATASQNRVIADVERFLSSSDRRIHLISGMTSSGKSTLARWLFKKSHTDREMRLISARRSASSEYLYTMLYGYGQDDSDGATPQRRSRGRNMPLRVNSDRQGMTYLIDDAHLISALKFEDSDIIFGTGNLVNDLMNFVSSISGKLVLIGDRYQVLYSDQALMPIFREHWADDGGVSESAELEEVIFVPERSGALDATKMLRNALIIGDNTVSSLSAGPGLELAVEGSIVERAADANRRIGTDSVVVVSTNAQALAVSCEIRKSRGFSGTVDRGDDLEIFGSYEKRRPEKNSFILPRGSTHRVARVGERAEISQSLTGRKELIRVSYRQIDLTSGESIHIFEEFVSSTERITADEALAVEISASAPDVIYAARYAYAVTAHRMQRYPRPSCIADGTPAGDRDLESFQRRLYTSISKAELCTELVGFKPIGRLHFCDLRPVEPSRTGKKINRVFPIRISEQTELCAKIADSVSEALVGGAWSVNPTRSLPYREDFEASHPGGVAAFSVTYKDDQKVATIRDVSGAAAAYFETSLGPCTDFWSALPHDGALACRAIADQLEGRWRLLAAWPSGGHELRIQIERLDHAEVVDLQAYYKKGGWVSVVSFVAATSKNAADEFSRLLGARPAS